jgi:hypothetical protein
MSADRVAHPTYWKALPGFGRGMVFTAGSLAENSPGSDLYRAIDMTEWMQISWTRLNGVGGEEISAFITSSNTLDGDPAVGLVFDIGQVGFSFGGVVKAAFNQYALDLMPGVLAIGGNPVVGARQAGWTPMTGAGNTVTAYDVSSITLPQLAARVAAIQNSLATHGRIGA